jgi:hypothetical protein
MRGLRRQKRPCTLLGIIALLFNVLVTLSCCAHSTFADSPFGGGLVICAANGAKSLPADRDSKERFAIGHCPACTSSQIVLGVGIVLIPAEFSIPVARAPLSSDISLLPLHLSLGGIQSRAPPVAV